MEYKAQEIEKKWQNFWDDHQTFKTIVNENDKRPKFYALDMFPYPSGAGLHVGHPEGYTATDIICRYKRMKGFNVLHPMGWDSFGLPAENYAIKTGTHPEIITKKNIETFKRQLKSFGFSYDWDREIATSNLNYYKWTQWIFTLLYNKRLAYEDEISVNWCPELKTVLANEEIVDGKSEVGGHDVIRIPMKQWMLKITDYAERLLEDLDTLDWPENIKEMQRNWIGKSIGASVLFKTQDGKYDIEVFTTRADTLFGATYMVLAPEHPLIDKIAGQEKLAEIKSYREQTRKKSDLERTDLNKDKTGVFIGSYAINPVNNKKIPIWISDYVLLSYGTGAIMAVPAHDERDFEFAQKFKLDIIQVLDGGDVSKEAYTEDGTHINSHFLNGLLKQEAIDKMISWLEEKQCGKKKINYKLRDWIFSRQRYWGEPFPLLKYEDGTVRCLGPDELPVTLPQVEKYEPSGTGQSPLSTIDTWVHVIDPKTGKKAKRETNTMPQWAGSCWYYLRFIDPGNENFAWDKKLEKYWMPVDLYIGGVEHAVLHLLYARFWHKVLFDLNLVSTKEPFQKLINQGLILGEDGEKMSKSRGNVINPDQIISEYGADTLRLYEMFMGPLEKVKPWNMNGLKGISNFLTRSFKFFGTRENLHENNEELDILKELHKTIKKVSHDIESINFNTAISQMMIFLNYSTKKSKVSLKTAKIYSQLLSPFAPHLAEELWQILGEKDSITNSSWPDYDETLTLDDLVTIAIQVNGKMRATIEIDKKLSKDEVLKLAREEEKVAKFLQGKESLKEIYVPQKICNFVVR